MMDGTALRPPAGVRAIAAILREVEGVCFLLTSPSPETLDRCERILESASLSFAGLQPDLASAGRDPAALSAVEQLRSALGRAGQLLESSFQYHEQWRRRLCASLAGYRPGGDPAALSHRGRVSLQG
jgi:hypothetical protein